MKKRFAVLLSEFKYLFRTKKLPITCLLVMCAQLSIAEKKLKQSSFAGYYSDNTGD